MQGWILQLTIISVITLSLLFLFADKVRRSPFWHATVIPLASIIGSGFLVVTPLFMLILGKYALPAIIMMTCLAFFIGYVIQ